MYCNMGVQWPKIVLQQGGLLVGPLNCNTPSCIVTEKA